LKLRCDGWILRLMRRLDERQGSLFDWALGRVEEVDPSPRPSLAREGSPKDEPKSPFIHPKAERQTRLNDQLVGYAFTRARRRSIGMTVGPEGLSVRAPRWVSLRDVEAALQERAAWILRHLVQQRSREQASREREPVWQDGGTFRLLGKPITIRLEPGLRECRPSWDDGPGRLQLPTPEGCVLYVGLAKDGSDTIQDVVHTWLQRRVRTLFEQRCAMHAPKLQVQVRSISLSAARTRWGSAGIDGSIRLNWRLIHYPMACIDYVVVHELAHLRHMNHSPAFWALVATLIPEHRALRRQLRESQHE
jgi:predicted metal-dependent hydrolase